MKAKCLMQNENQDIIVQGNFYAEELDKVTIWFDH